MTDRLLSLAEAAQILGLTPHAMYRWRTRGEGPPSLRIGGRVRYREAALVEWIEQQESASLRGGRPIGNQGTP